MIDALEYGIYVSACMHNPLATRTSATQWILLCFNLVFSSPAHSHYPTLTCRHVFDSISRKDDGLRYTIRASYLEIYNEMCYDLLADPAVTPMQQVRWRLVVAGGRECAFVCGG